MKSNPVNIYELADLETPWCLRVAVTLDIASLLAQGITHIDDLATKTHSNRKILLLVLRSLTEKGIFVEEKPYEFTMNEASKQLLEPAVKIFLDQNGLGGKFTTVWNTLPFMVKTGKTGYEQINGRSFWEDLEQNTKLADEFDDLIGPIGHGDQQTEIELSRDWNTIQTVIDIGGGTGSFLAGLVALHPHITGTLVDLPRTVAKAPKLFQEKGVDKRITKKGQSFFEGLPKGLDIYILRGILNDWPDDDAIRILRRCKEAMKKESELVIIKGVATDTTPKNIPIEMLLCGGTYRTIEEYKVLLTKAGLEITAIKEMKDGNRMLECRLT